jgi:hypothetical protein
MNFFFAPSQANVASRRNAAPSSLISERSRVLLHDTLRSFRRGFAVISVKHLPISDARGAGAD